MSREKEQQLKLLDRFEIVLDNPEEVYFAGQEITGKVLIECSRSMQLNEVLFEVKGRARTHWIQSRKTCSANEAYFCEQFNTSFTSKLPKNNQDGAKEQKLSFKNDSKYMGRTLPTGLHQIPFSYTLPKHLPSSFEGEFGFVRYTCRAICERPWDFDIVCFQAFTVIGVEDLNQQAEMLSLPLETRSSSPISLFCMKLGSVGTELRIAKGGYTPGEDIHLNLRIQNQSRRSLRGLGVRLCQIVTYRSKTFAGTELQRTIRNMVQNVIASHKVRRGAEFCWQDRTISVPSIPPKMITKCKLIDVSYCLELYCNSPKFAISLPVVIGTIPLLPKTILSKKILNGTVTPIAAKNTEKMVADERTPETTGSGMKSCKVTVTDESGKTVERSEPKRTEGGALEEDEGEGGDIDKMDPETERLQKDAAKKRVRMPSSVLSELYPVLPSPYYKKVCSGPIVLNANGDYRERKFHFGQNIYAPKYPFYE